MIIPLTLHDDDILEPTESLLVQLQLPSSASGTMLGIETAVINILDNDSKQQELSCNIILTSL